jgi:hypothetical protein
MITCNNLILHIDRKVGQKLVWGEYKNFKWWNRIAIVTIRQSETKMYSYIRNNFRDVLLRYLRVGKRGVPFD